MWQCSLYSSATARRRRKRAFSSNPHLPSTSTFMASSSSSSSSTSGALSLGSIPPAGSDLESEEMDSVSPPVPTAGVAPESTDSTPATSSQGASPVQRRHDQREAEETGKGDDDAMEVEHDAPETRKKFGSNVSALRFERNERRKSPVRSEKKGSSPPASAAAIDEGQ